MNRVRFNVFGRLYDLERQGTRWRAWAVGNEGKRVPAGFVVPEFVGEEELGEFLFDLFHELATPGNGDVWRVG